MNPDTKQFDELTEEEFEELRRHPDFHRKGIFQLGEEIPLRGYRWKVISLAAGRMVLEVLGQTKRALKKEKSK